MTKYALLIGVSEYGEGIPALSAPPNDVAAMKRVLKNPEMAGFDHVIPLVNPDSSAMRLEISKLFKKAKKADLVLFYFSGHGLTDDDERLYLSAKETNKEYFQATSVAAKFIQDQSRDSYCKRQVLILDCCYSGAFKEGWQPRDIGLDLQKELGGEGRVVLTASSATQKAFEQEGETLAVYTKYLVEGIETGAADKDGDGKIFVDELHKYASAKVKEAKPKMKPQIIHDQEGFEILISKAPRNDPTLEFRQLVEKYIHNGEVSSVGKRILEKKRQEFSLEPEVAAQIIDEVLEPYREHRQNLAGYQEVVEEILRNVEEIDDSILDELNDLQDLLGLEDKDVDDVRRKIDAHLQEAKTERKQTYAIRDWEKREAKRIQKTARKKPPQSFLEDLGNGVKLEMILIPEGSFLMGTVGSRNFFLNFLLNDERPQHAVDITEPFYLGKFQVTQRQWEIVMGENPSKFQNRNSYPVEQVSWNDCQDFLQKLNQKTGKKYRLPSEAEWEYACRAGTRTQYYFGDNEEQLANYAWFTRNSGMETHPVGKKKPNQFGLYDMHGNVWEWCEDSWSSNYKVSRSQKPFVNSTNKKVIRGGSYNYTRKFCRSAFRLASSPDLRNLYIGVRVAVSLQ